MQPISRQTIIERRQPFIRWSAVVAGALAAGAIWLVLTLLFDGGALAAIDPDEVENASAFCFGTTAGSVIAALLAMGAGGWLAGRLAAHYDRKLVGLHGALVWAIASVFGLVLMASVVSELADRPEGRRGPADHHAANLGGDDMIDDAIRSANVQLKAQNAPQLDKDAVIDASRFAVTPQGTLDRSAFITRLDETTSLSRPEAEAAVLALGERTPDVIAHANRIAAHREHALEAAQRTGRAMLLGGVTLLLSLGAAIGGALLALRNRRTRRDDDDTLRTHTTAPYPVVTE